MEPQPTPSPAAGPSAASAQLQALLELKAQMERLHAELEYVRLMLRVGVRRF
jgi:hypothetical protein